MIAKSLEIFTYRPGNTPLQTTTFKITLEQVTRATFSYTCLGIFAVQVVECCCSYSPPALQITAATHKLAQSWTHVHFAKHVAATCKMLPILLGLYRLSLDTRDFSHAFPEFLIGILRLLPPLWLAWIVFRFTITIRILLGKPIKKNALTLLLKKAHLPHKKLLQRSFLLDKFRN